LFFTEIWTKFKNFKGGQSEVLSTGILFIRRQSAVWSHVGRWLKEEDDDEELAVKAYSLRQSFAGG